MNLEQDIDDVLIDDYFERRFYLDIMKNPDIPDFKKKWNKCSDRINENCIFISNIPLNVDENLIFELFSKSYD